MFEAADTLTNLHVGLDRYTDQVAELQTLCWKKGVFKRNHDTLYSETSFTREKSLKSSYRETIYEFLCRCLSGASGRLEIVAMEI